MTKLIGGFFAIMATYIVVSFCFWLGWNIFAVEVLGLHGVEFYQACAGALLITTIKLCFGMDQMTQDMDLDT